MQYKIKKAKITKGRTLEVELIEINDDKTENEVTKKCSQLVHNDMYVVFDRLKFHFAHLCDTKESDLVPSIQNYDIDLLNKIKVTSFSVSGDEGNQGVCIVGQREVGIKTLNLVSPFQPYEDEDNYQFASDLAADVEACIFEVEEYLFKQKYAIKQLEFEFEEKAERDPESVEMDQEAGNVAREVLSKIGEAIIKPRKAGKKKNMEPVAFGEEVTKVDFYEEAI